MGPRKERRPVPATSFVGREEDLAALAERLDGGARLVTVIGGPGFGKTRLVTESLRARWRVGADDAWFCDLTEARSADEVCSSVAVALGIVLVGARDPAVDQVGDALAARGRGLVVLDNFEQIVAHAEETVGAWLGAAPEMRFVVTSRERLALPHEQLLELAPLRVPPDEDPLHRSEAVTLFVDRARRIRRSYRLTSGDAPHVSAIVRALDGIPLAIELAAARMGLLGPAQIRERLTQARGQLAPSRALEVVAGEARGVPARQATLRGAIDWSWDLLRPWERTALAQLSVFRGSFDLEAAEAVLDLGARDGAPTTLEVLASLHDKSLLVSRSTPVLRGERRFGLLVVIREYAAEKAIDSGSLDATEARYSAFTLERGRTLAREAEGPGGREALARLALEAENLAFVHERAMAAEPPAAEAALDAALALEPLIARRGPVARLLSLLDAALGAGGGLDAALGAGGGVDAARIARARRARADAKRILGRTPESIADCEAALAAAVQTRDVGLLARVEIATGRTLLELERFAEARRHMERALTLSREAGDRAQVGSAWMNLGNICLWEGRGREAREAFESCLVAAREGDDPQGAGMAEASLGNLDLEIGHLAAARKHFARALRLFGRRGDRQAEGLLGVLLASLDFEEGRLDDARERLAESLRLLRDVGHRRGESFALCLLGECDWVEGRPDRARERFEHALRIQRERGHRRHEVMTLAHLACLEAEEGNLDVAERAVTTAEARVAEAPSPAFEAAAWVSRGQLELALARTAGADEAERRRGIARALAAKARARPEGVSGAGHSTELRFLLARLEKRLEEAEVDSLVVRSDGGRFRPPRGKWVDLTRRRVLQRLLRHLAGRRLEAPGAPTDLDGMVEVGWPGERMRPDAAATRVYGAVSTLRKLGLASVLESREDGYLLNPRVPLVVAP